MNSLLWTFLRLRKTCKHASMSITSDSDSDNSLTVSLKMVLAGHADQAPRKGGRQSNSRERGPGTRVPSPGAPSAPSAPFTPSPAPAPGPAPAPARRARRRGPTDLLRGERRRLGRIEPGLLTPDSPLPIPAGPLEGATSGPLPHPTPICRLRPLDAVLSHSGLPKTWETHLTV